MNLLVGHDIPPGAQVFVLLGTLLGAIFGGMLVLFIAGEILSDPGGVQGVVLVLAWLVVPLLLAILALVRPGAGYSVLVVLVGVVLLSTLAAIPLADAVWEFEDTHGPINLMVIIGVLIPLVALGRSMPARAGWLMIAVIAGFSILQAMSLALVGQWSVVLVLMVLMAPFIAVAILFMIAGAKARGQRRSPRPSEEIGPPPGPLATTGDD